MTIWPVLTATEPACDAATEKQLRAQCVADCDRDSLGLDPMIQAVRVLLVSTE